MSKPGPVVLLSPDGRRSGSGGRTSREVEYLRHYVLPAGHACLSHRCRRFAGFRYRQLGADARILTDIFRLGVRGPDRADCDPRRGRQHCLACAIMAGPPPERRPQTPEASTSVRRIRIVRSGVVGHCHPACFSAQSSANSATSSHPSMAGSRWGPSNSTISVTVLDL
jgi:hypothetical protein